MFTGQNLVISGGTFHHTVARTALSICFDKLAEKASPLSFHLADSDLSHSTCFTNTRTKILERMKAWALRDIEKDKFVMWLHGPAGGGKTAIGRTIAKWCEDEGILLGEFFFSRADGTGVQLDSLAPTLAYRMAVHTLQDAKEAISDVVNHDPHIFLAPLAIQLKKLVMEPLNLLAPCGIVPYVIILDGLDETLSSDDQQLVLNVISETLYQLNPTLRILICCRPEPTIVTAFNDADSPLNSISTIISLNDDVDADADIRAFFVEKFARTKKQLPHPPIEDWPTAEDFDYLVKKSSGQFIFAATVERYVCSPKHRHQAVARLKHVLDLSLLPNLEDKKKHPFADLDALYLLILRTRNDVNMSVNATAVCIEYPKYFIAISPTDLSKVLNIDLSETWVILYELASLFDTSEESIRPFHASLGDFLFDISRSADLFRNEGDITAGITCAMLSQGRDPEVLSYHVFSRLLGEATPRQDLRDILSQMEPVSIFRRPASTRRYKQRSKGAYYLIPLLRRLENHVSPDAYKNLVTYFDQHFKLFLPLGYWRSKIFKIKKRVDLNDTDDSMPTIHSDSDTSEDDSESDSEDSEQVRRRGNIRVSRSHTYRVSKLIPLSTSPAWDEIDAMIRLTGPDSLLGLCDEARFARSHLKKTMSALLKGSKQARAALFCLKQIQSADITNDLQIGFAKLLPHSLSYAEQLPELRTAIQQLQTHHLIYQGLPVETRKAITDYTRGIRIAVRTVPMQQQQQQQQQNVPIINAPHGDDDMMVDIVPATPVNGGGAGRARVPFQTTLSTLSQGESTRSPFDHSSPSSNASGADDHSHLDDLGRSGPSSVASNYPSSALPSSPQPTFDPSPRLSVNFGNTFVRLPKWNTIPLPQLSPNLNAQSPLPVRKPQSPPRLLMPDDQQQQQQQQQLNVPIINAPHGDDDMMDGPQLCIVPATPVSGNGAGRATVASSSRSNSNNDTTNLSATSGFIFPNDHSQQRQQQQQQPRPRTYSDLWNPNHFSASSGLENGNAEGGYDYQRQQLQTFTFGGTHDASKTSGKWFLPHKGSDFITNFAFVPPSPPQTFTFGGTHGASTTSGNEFLSPNSLRRSVSDAPRHYRQSRLDDIRTSASNYLFPPNVDFHTGQQQQYLHPSQVPPSASQPHSLNLLSAAGSASNPNLSLSSSSPGMGPFRRASLGTRSDRGAEVWGTLGTQGTLAAPRRMSPYPGLNASPRVRYTDLELDPVLTFGNGDNKSGSGTGMGLGMEMGDLGEPPVGAGFSDEVALSRRGSYAGLDATMAGAGGSQKAESVASSRERNQSRQPRSNVPSGSQTDVLPTQVPNVNVTTGRTASASHRRRKQDANFACTVPGCGSTFTRHFNLKGHLRSHFEGKPYKCHWPGCGKGFAKQHDCKRHEQLHSNFRPFECVGCMKQFARLVALDRHLRSEIGVECARIVQRGKGSGGGGGGVKTGNMESGYDMSGITMTGGMVELGMESEEQKRPIPKRRQTGGGGGGGADMWSGVTL